MIYFLGCLGVPLLPWPPPLPSRRGAPPHDPCFGDLLVLLGFVAIVFSF